MNDHPIRPIADRKSRLAAWRGYCRRRRPRSPISAFRSPTFWPAFRTAWLRSITIGGSPTSMPRPSGCGTARPPMSSARRSSILRRPTPTIRSSLTICIEEERRARRVQRLFGAVRRVAGGARLSASARLHRLLPRCFARARRPSRAPARRRQARVRRVGQSAHLRDLARSHPCGRPQGHIHSRQPEQRRPSSATRPRR